MNQYYPYPDYLDTHTPWLGQIPSHWSVVPLFSMYRRCKRIGFSDEELLSVYRDFGVIPKSSREDNFNKPSEDLSVYQLVLPRDLVTNKMKTWQGSIAISSIKGIVSPAYYIFQPSHQENDRYLHYLLRSPKYIVGYQASSKGIRVNQWDLDQNLFRKFPVVIPPAHEQQVIASFLDWETTRIDALIEKKKRLIELLQEKRQAIITRAVTKGLDPNVPMKDSGVKWLGEVSEHWKVKQYRYSTQIFRGKFGHRPRNDPKFYDGPFPFVQTGDVAQATKYLTNYTQTLNELGASVSFEFPAGTLLMAIAANVGDTAILKFNAYCPDSIVGFKPNKDVDVEYLQYSFETCLHGLLTASTENTQSNLNIDRISSVKACFPPLKEQQDICAYLNRLISQYKAIQDTSTKSIRLLQERRSALITAAVTGQIDVRESV